MEEEEDSKRLSFLADGRERRRLRVKEGVDISLRRRLLVSMRNENKKPIANLPSLIIIRTLKLNSKLKKLKREAFISYETVRMTSI